VKSERRARVENVVPKVLSDPKEKPDPSVQWVKKEMMDLKDCQDWRDLQDQKELRDRLDLREILDLPAHLVLLVHRESYLFFPPNYSSKEIVLRAHPAERSVIRQPTVKKCTKIATSAQLVAVASRTTDRKKI